MNTLAILAAAILPFFIALVYAIVPHILAPSPSKPPTRAPTCSDLLGLAGVNVPPKLPVMYVFIVI